MILAGSKAVLDALAVLHSAIALLHPIRALLLSYIKDRDTALLASKRRSHSPSESTGFREKRAALDEITATHEFLDVHK